MGMKNRFQEAIQNVQRQRHLARRSVAMVLVLAMLTAMSVSWRLHQDGIALAADDTRYYCGKEEHKHTDDCYIEGTEPICGYEEEKSSKKRWIRRMAQGTVTPALRTGTKPGASRKVSPSRRKSRSRKWCCTTTPRIATRKKKC